MAKKLLVFLFMGLVTGQNDFMKYVVWGGPEKGCDTSEGVGQAVITCTLKSGNVTLNVDRSASSLKITCEQQSSFSCNELEESRAHISNYVTVKGQTDRHISLLDVNSCILPKENLKCLLELVNATSTEVLRLFYCEGTVTPEHLNGLDAVKFRMNNVDANTTTIPYSAISVLPSLRSFTLKGGSLVLHKQNVSLPNLRTIELAQGDLEVIPNDAFANTPYIQTLMLWGNKINTVDEDAFNGLSVLVNVSLNSNDISKLPSKLFSHSPLTERVYLYSNRLVILQKDLFSGLRHLEEVIIKSNRANLTLQETFSHLPSLSKLQLETSNIKYLPENLFRNSTALKTLFLKGNKLENLPPSIFEDQKLVYIDLSDNRISELPAMLLKHQSVLEELDLRRNVLKDLPVGLFSEAIRLKVLNLNDNQIVVLASGAFNGARNLIELGVSGNRIHSLHTDTFENMPSLEILSLSRNNVTISENKNTLRVISPELYAAGDYTKSYEYYSPFKSLKNLKVLDLSKNDVSIVCEDWRQFLALETLNLSYNSIDLLSDVSMYFKDLVIDVRHNQITTIVPTKYETTNKPTILLDYNPFVCDCFLYEFIRTIKTSQNTAVLKMDDSKCASPEHLKNTQISQLTPNILYCEVPCDNCTCKIRPYNNRFDINCHKLPPKLPLIPDTFEAMKLANEIHLKTKADFIPNYYSYVDMSNLNLTIAPSVDSSMELNLKNNNLELAPLELFAKNCSLYLSNNPFLCGCSYYDNVMNLLKYRHFIRDFNETRCKDGGLVSNVNLQQICVARNAAVIGSTIGFFGVILAIFTVIAYKYSTEIRILLRKYNLWWGDEFNCDKEYDAFVSYSHQDESYVVDHLVPNLENGRPKLKLCVHYRNWVVGDFIPAQIARSVEQSTKTIIVLSKNFINSVWGHMEFRTAHGKGKVIILMLDDIATDDNNLDQELKAYIAMNTYVKARDPLVFDRIRDAILCRSVPKSYKNLNMQLKDEKLGGLNKEIVIIK